MPKINSGRCPRRPCRGAPDTEEKLTRTNEDAELQAAWKKIGAACKGKLKKAILRGAVAIPRKRALSIARMAPAMRAAQAESYLKTGRSLRLPRYRDVVDAALKVIQRKDGSARNQRRQARRGVKETTVNTLARLLNGKKVTAAGKTVAVPPLDTEKVYELRSRLDRELGLVAKVVVDLPRLRGMRATKAEKEAIRECLERATTYGALILEMLDRSPTA